MNSRFPLLLAVLSLACGPEDPSSSSKVSYSLGATVLEGWSGTSTQLATDTTVRSDCPKGTVASGVVFRAASATGSAALQLWCEPLLTSGLSNLPIRSQKLGHGSAPDDVSGCSTDHVLVGLWHGEGSKQAPLRGVMSSCAPLESWSNPQPPVMPSDGLKLGSGLMTNLSWCEQGYAMTGVEAVLSVNPQGLSSPLRAVCTRIEVTSR